jgi:hypothetical protein
VSVDSEYAASTNGAGAEGSGASGLTPAAAELMRNRPELLVGAAFAGGMIAAFLLRRLGR